MEGIFSNTYNDKAKPCVDIYSIDGNRRESHREIRSSTSRTTLMTTEIINGSFLTHAGRISSISSMHPSSVYIFKRILSSQRRTDALFRVIWHVSFHDDDE